MTDRHLKGIYYIQITIQILFKKCLIKNENGLYSVVFDNLRGLIKKKYKGDNVLLNEC